MTLETRRAASKEFQAHRAGFASRLIAAVIDLCILALFGFLVLGFVALIRFLLSSRPFEIPHIPGWANSIWAVGVYTIYFTYEWATTGRTLGNQLAGLRVVTPTGRLLPAWRAVVRSLLYLVFPAGLLWVLVSVRNASVQDHLVGSAVIYDWYYKAPQSPSRADTGDPRSANQ